MDCRMEQFEYMQLEDGTIRITDVSKDARAVMVPRQIDGRDVTEIGQNAFTKPSALSCVMLPESIRRIEENAFRTSPRVVILAYQNSEAERYAEKNRMLHMFLTTQNEQQIRMIMEKIPAEYVCGEYLYTRNDDNEATISRYTGMIRGDALFIPMELDGCRVTGIGKAAFRKLEYKRYILPGDVREIGESAFDMCFQMESIALPDRLERIGDRAFNRCDGLRRIILPASVKAVGVEAFRGCESLEYASVLSKDVVLSSNAFACRRGEVMLIGKLGSTVIEYAREHRMPFRIIREDEGEA